MRVFILLTAGMLMLLAAPAFAQVNSDNALKNFGDEELELLTGDEDLDALTMDLLESDFDHFDTETKDLNRESAQAQLLLDHIQAEVNVMRRENLLYQDQLDRLNEDIEHYEALIDDLERENERLMAENDALSADKRAMEEEDRQTVAQNVQQFRENEIRIIRYDEIVSGFNYEIVELEDLIEENDETIVRQLELMEVCEDIIQTNEMLLQPSGK